MGLAIAVGVLADLNQEDEEGAQYFRDELLIANQLLREEGFPEHIEPETLSFVSGRSECDSFPYSFIHYLRYAYANVVENADWVAQPLADGFDPCEDELLEEVSLRFESHLLSHSDAEGFYVPVDFDDVIFGDELTGGMLGSSYRLQEELIQVAPALGIRLKDGYLSDAEALRINQLLSDGGNCLLRELCSWMTLYEAARISIEHKTAIVFC